MTKPRPAAADREAQAVAADASQGGPSWPTWPTWRDDVRYCLWVFLAVRVGLTIVAMVAVGAIQALGPVDVPGWPAGGVETGWRSAVTAWERQDALWYLRIAADGYGTDEGSAAFFPLYPMTVRVVSVLLGNHPLLAGYLVSNAAYLGALVLFLRLSRFEYDEAIAHRAVVYLAVFPTAFFFIAPYTESLFLLLAVASFWFARRRKWGPTLAVGIAAGMTRSAAIVLTPALLVEAVREYRETKDAPALARHAVAAAGPWIGALLYFLFWELLGGNWRQPFDAQAGWQRTRSLPWTTLWNGTREALKVVTQGGGTWLFIDWLFVVCALAALVWLARRAAVSYTLYAGASLVLPLLLVFPPRPFMSMPRFIAVVFPLFWALAALGGRPGRHEMILGASAGFMALLAAFFVTWHFIF